MGSVGGADLPDRVMDCGEVAGCRLDITLAGTHTYIMLSCIRRAIPRLPGLLGLVVVMVVFANVGWAQYLISTVTETPGTFPYLSPDIVQRNLLINAFNFQMSMFGAISGGGNLAALNFFALTGCLVGALLIVFNAKYRKAIIIAPWLLVVIITVFAPYGSKLLFYPVAKEALGGGLTGMGAEEVSDCTGDNAARCGFTPQLAAIHAASTVQLMFSDVFRSVGWDGLMQRIEGEENLGNAEELVFTEDIANVQIPKFKAQCEALGFDRLAKIYTGSVTPVAAAASSAATSPASSTPILTAGKLIQDLDQFYAGDMTNSGPPDIGVFYGDADFQAQNWEPEAKDAYQKGLEKIYSALYEGQHLPIIVGCSSSSSCMTVDAALEKIDEAGFFRVSNGADALLPGFFFTWKGAQNFTSTSFENPSPADARKCYQGEVSNFGSNVDMTSGNIGAGARPDECANAPIPINSNPNTQQGAYMSLRSSSYADDIYDVQLKAIYDLFGGSTSDQSLANMPIGVISYNAVSNAPAPSAPQQGEARGTYDCVAEGKKLIDSIIDSAYGEEGGKAKNFANFAALLKGGEGHANVPEVLERTHLTNVTEDEANNNANFELNKRVNDYLRVINGRFTEARNNPSINMGSEKDRHALLLTIILKKMEESTAAAKPAVQNSDENAAAEASKTPEVVGSEGLTWLGGGVAKFLGSWIANIGSAFIGPFSQALIYFLSILVDIAMLALIVLTPFLFMAGLFVPSMAIGVLSVVVMGAFILKFVPVTLIIMNNLGMMIYRFIDVSGTEESRVMQSLIIIAMAGLYANLVGMTFFLLFKLGDPAAILGRFTALDGAAKQLADQGMAATLTALAAATTVATGGAAAALGYGSMANSARKAANKLGISNAMLDGAKGVLESTTDDKKGPGGQSEDVSDSNIPEGLTEEQRNRLFDPRADLARKHAMDKYGLTALQANELIAKGSYSDGTNSYSLNEDGDVWTVSPGDMFAAPGARSTQSRYGVGGISAQEAIEGRDAPVGAPDSLIEAPDAVSEQARYEKDGKTAQEAIEGKPLPADMAAGTAEQPSAIGGPGTTGTGAIAQGAGPLQVSVVDGKLSAVAEVGNMQALAEGNSVQAKAAAIKEDALAKQIAEQNQTLETAKKNASPADIDKINAAQKALGEIKSDQDLADFQASAIGKDARSIMIGAKGRENYTRNMNDQISAELARVDAMIASGQGDMAANKAYRKKLAETDPIALTQGELMARMGTLSEMRQAAEIRGAADNMPGFGQTVWSGIYGAATGGKGALGKIPVIGPAIAEATNEFYQAPERARAWNAVGGRKEYKQLQADAQRMGFFNKEMAPIAAGTQYQSMAAVGAFQVQADLARQTASEAVAKSRSQYEAMVINSQSIRGGNPSDTTFRNFMTAGELTGLGRMEAADRVASVRQEAFLMQGQSMTVKRAIQVDNDGKVVIDEKTKLPVAALDANMQLKLNADGTPVNYKIEEVNTALTAQALHKFKGDITTKKYAGSFDDMMISHYGLTEKQYLRGNNDWDSTRNMNRSAAAAATFARKDVGTDYLIGGHTKMVEGKIRFKDSQAQYEKLVEFRGDENRMKAEFLQTQIAANGFDGVLKAAASLPKPAYDFAKEGKLAGEQLRNYQREAMDKYATEMLKGQGKLMKLEAVFDEAAEKGATKYEEIAYIAPARSATRKAKLNEAINKEFAKMFELEGIKFDAAAHKSAPVRKNGVTGQLDSLVKSLTEGISGKVNKEDLGRAFSLFTQAIKDLDDSSVSLTREVEYVDDKGQKRSMTYATAGISAEAYTRAKATIQSQDPSLWDIISGVFSEDTRLDNGKTYYRTASLGIDDDGAKRDNISSKGMTVKRSKNSNDSDDN